MSAEVNVLLTLAKANAVSGATATPARTSASPLTPVQLVPSGNRIVAEIPGIPSRPRRRSRVDWRRRSSGTGPPAIGGPADADGTGGDAGGPDCAGAEGAGADGPTDEDAELADGPSDDRAPSATWSGGPFRPPAARTSPTPSTAMPAAAARSSPAVRPGRGRFRRSPRGP